MGYCLAKPDSDLSLVHEYDFFVYLYCNALIPYNYMQGAVNML